MSRPSVSIIIPAWNAEDSIRRITESILAQKSEDFELLLIDDGSTDETLEVLKNIEKSDKRVRVFTKPNGGPSSARNLGLEKARGTYIQFYDADDDIEPDAIVKVAEAMADNSSDLVVSGWQIDLQNKSELIKAYKQVSPKRETIAKDVSTYVLRSIGSSGTLYNLWNKLFRADIIREHNLRFREDLRFGEDLIFSLEYLRHTNKLDVIPDITYHYQANSSTSVFAKSSIIPEYRLANDEAIVEFTGKNPTAEQYDLVQWIRWRWQVSYWSLVSRSKHNFWEKLQLIRQFRPSRLTVARSGHHIGYKKLFIEIIARIASLTAPSSLLIGWLFSAAKSSVMSLKLLLKSKQTPQKSQ